MKGAGWCQPPSVRGSCHLAWFCLFWEKKATRDTSCVWGLPTVSALPSTGLAVAYGFELLLPSHLTTLLSLTCILSLFQRSSAQTSMRKSN